MGLVLAFSAALLCACNNLFMRRSIDAGGSTKAFLVFMELFSLVVAILLGPVRSGHYQWNPQIAIIGLLAGLLLGIMMWALGKAMENGPPGLTVAFLNSSAVVPAIIMVMLFGAAFGHTYQWWNGVGSTLVVVGLFWASWQSTKQEGINRLFWVTFAAIAFWCHVIFLVVLQWRALLLNPNVPVSRLVPFKIDVSASEWFMPMIFVSATLFLLYRFVTDEKRMPKKIEVAYGLFGGVCNGACTYFLIKAAQNASVFENAMIFPVFGVSLIVLCNAWGRALYKENVHWKAIAVCLFGLFVGTVDWRLFF